ncbi:hypothetical protein AOZ06_19070 [Kibdelosporangium phytohabitans]|uniref:Uncharacterized protein n=1 Tax=Kibdelosporangium phytohabitans TaxID=860235 RepID=A0A0N9I202_9PSEU|nr:hypothetical protein AOZ06_19070 [Kibdelosporangium phytohabitans]
MTLRSSAGTPGMGGGGTLLVGSVPGAGVPATAGGADPATAGGADPATAGGADPATAGGVGPVSAGGAGVAWFDGTSSKVATTPITASDANPATIGASRGRRRLVARRSSARILAWLRGGRSRGAGSMLVIGQPPGSPWEGAD